MKRLPFVLAAILILVGWAFMTLGSQEDGDNTTVLSPTTTDDGFKKVESIDMTFEWKVVDDALEIVLTSPTDGWLAIGFDPTTVMMDSDIYIGYVDADGAATVRDDFATWYTSHDPDEELGGTNDATAIGGSESEEGSRLHFRIPLESGDEYDAPLQPGQQHVVMLAYGVNDDMTKRHRDRSKFKVTL